VTDPFLQRPAGENQRHGERADRRGGAQQPEADRPGGEDVAGEDRQQRSGTSEQHGEQVERHGAEQYLVGPHERHAGEDAAQGACRVRRLVGVMHGQGEAEGD